MKSSLRHKIEKPNSSFSAVCIAEVMQVDDDGNVAQEMQGHSTRREMA